MSWLSRLVFGPERDAEPRPVQVIVISALPEDVRMQVRHHAGEIARLVRDHAGGDD